MRLIDSQRPRQPPPTRTDSCRKCPTQFQLARKLFWNFFRSSAEPVNFIYLCGRLSLSPSLFERPSLSLNQSPYSSQYPYLSKSRHLSQSPPVFLIHLLIRTAAESACVCHCMRWSLEWFITDLYSNYDLNNLSFQNFLSEGNLCSECFSDHSTPKLRLWDSEALPILLIARYSQI